MVDEQLNQLLEEMAELEHEIEKFFEQPDALSKPGEFAVLVAKKHELQMKIDQHRESQ